MLCKQSIEIFSCAVGVKVFNPFQITICDFISIDYNLNHISISHFPGIRYIAPKIIHHQSGLQQFREIENQSNALRTMWLVITHFRSLPTHISKQSQTGSPQTHGQLFAFSNHQSCHFRYPPKLRTEHIRMNFLQDIFFRYYQPHACHCFINRLWSDGKHQIHLEFV